MLILCMVTIKTEDSDRNLNMQRNSQEKNINLKKYLKIFSRLFKYFSITSILALSIWSTTLIQPTIAEEAKLHTLTVTGQSQEMIPATITQAQLGVEMQGKNASELQQQVAKKTSAVIDLLRSRQIERLQTTGISLQPNYDYNNNERRFLGYNATNIVSFRIKTEQIGNLLDEAVKVGATRIDSLSFTAGDEAIAIAQKQALSKATTDAQAQAEVVLKALNLSSKEVVKIQIHDTNTSQPRPLQYEAAMMKAADSTPVIGGEQTVRASVTLEISY
jgi:uncharacterized protein